jgi:tRNA(fMet)-specific endonuclease VapC
MQCVQVPESAAEYYAGIKRFRRNIGRPILDTDCWIASTAMAIGAILVSHDNDVQGIPGLSVEDWW